MSKNGSPPLVLMHVDQSLTLWAFLDVYGSTRKIRMLGTTMIESSHRPGNAIMFKSSFIIFLLLIFIKAIFY